ncbi:hypothetical protein BGZ94_004843, partial [Podila epigama]
MPPKPNPPMNRGIGSLDQLNQQQQQQQYQHTLDSGVSNHGSLSTSMNTPTTTSSNPTPTKDTTAKKRSHKGGEKKRRKDGVVPDGTEVTEKKVQVSSCDTCKEGHRK